MNNLIIQGDVALRKIDSLPDGLTEEKDRTVALGEISDHGHTLTKQATLFKDSNGRMYVGNVKKDATLEHVKMSTMAKADHDALTLEKGCNYEVILQNEYNPHQEAWERVMD